ncbi:RHS repeat protein [Hymenobacter sp. BT175]|uniref:RHS repeat protein n=1 Tax=Hymenobacter translucens TaxID=2886507 RepID=UPI001D0DEEA0|nr:RHS repeat domain-containing protein [Hymenobacter translucens]MCC2548205.1 RHS repeat protein [Hymenobacter translucens]
MKHLILFALFLLVAAPEVKSQNPTFPKDISLVPPSPEASSLARYAAVPVNLYTGAPQISVPLTELRQGPLTVGLSLSYNATGHRVEDVASWVGLGWTLNGGGVVTRVVRGRPDDMPPQPGGSINFFSLTQQVNYNRLTDFSVGSNYAYWSTLYGISQGCTDGEPDIYYFNFNGYSGQFCFDWNRNIVVSSSKDVKIEPVFAGTPFASVINSWKITDGQGSVYRFQDAETTTQHTKHDGFKNCTSRSGLQFKSAWFLTSVTDVNQEHSIYFEYDSYQIKYGQRTSESIQHSIANCPTPTDGQLDWSISELEFDGLRLHRIRNSGSTASIVIRPDSVRSDTLGLTGRGNYNIRSLGSVSLLNSSGTEVKSFIFSYFPDNPTGRLTLKSIRQGRLSGLQVPYYDFRYNTAVALPADVRSRAQDHWGYFNGATGNTSLIPGCELALLGNRRFLIRAGADREVHPQYAQAGLLTEIIHATGGKTAFEYESNDYGYVNARELSTFSYYETQDVMVDLGVNCGDTTLALGTCRASTRQFTIAPNPACPAYQPYDPTCGITVKVDYSVFTCCAVTSGQKPYARIRDADGNLVFNSGTAQAGEQPRDSSHVTKLMPGTYTLEVFACNPADYQPTSGASGCDRAYIRVEYADFTNRPILKKLTGGIRIRSIRDYTGPRDARPIVRTFSYALPEAQEKSTGVIYDEPFYAYHTYYASQLGGTPGFVNCIYWLRLARSRTALGSTQGSHIGYREVRVTNMVDNAPYSQTCHRFSSPYDYPDRIVDDLPFPPPTSNSFKTGLLQEQVENRRENGQWLPVKSTRTSYEFFAQDVPGLVVAFPMGVTTGVPADPIVFLKEIYFNRLGFAQPSHVREYRYSTRDTSSFVQEKRFFYSPTGRQLGLEQHDLSPTLRRTTEYYYPFSDPVRPAVQAMAGPLHMLSVPIETITSIYEGLTRKVTGVEYTDFAYANNKLRLRAKMQLPLTQPVTDYGIRPTVAGIDPRMEETMLVDAYDKEGNAVELHQPHNQPIARLWGPGQALLAEAQNAHYDQVAASSFEKGGFTGRWKYDTTAAGRSPGGHTGAWAYRLGSGVWRDSIPAGVYRLSLWATEVPRVTWNNQPVTPLVVATPVRDERSFVLYQFVVTSTTVSDLNISGADGLIDELRLHPEDARLTTLTYLPLVGILSKTDPSNRTTRYEYDALGRLLLIRDEQGRILKGQEYHYARP